MDHYLVHQTRSVGAATHAIVIGAGDYPYLLNGTATLSDDHDGMGQLTSPAVSARAVAEWLISSYNNPEKPLDSVALLLSEANASNFLNPKTGVAITPERASYANVELALQDWADRGAENPDNLLIFYYCGHGVSQGTGMSLLLSEYGNKRHTPFDEALDFGKFRLAMSRNLPKQQIYFVDACRSSSDTLLLSYNAGRSPIQRDGGKSSKTPIYFATLSGEDAFGKKNEVSFFTKALLNGLNGTGADNFDDEEWTVTTTRLKQAIDYDVNRAFESGVKLRQVPPTNELSTFTIHQLTSEPQVPVIVTCSPDTENKNAQFTCVVNGVVKDQRAPADEHWNLTLEAGEYEFQATLPVGIRKPKKQPVKVRPIYKKVSIEV
jgi:Caspase domain